MPKVRWTPLIVGALAFASIGAGTASAQAIGTFRWQQQPYCNVVTLNVVQQGAIYQLDGFDDQCGAAAPRAAAAGIAVLNPNGSIGFGLTIVTAPGGTPVHVDATISLSSLSGNWRDSSGQSGAWTFVVGGNLGGAARPVPRASFPAGISAGNATITNVAPPVNGTDAATKGYVDAANAADRAYADAGDAGVRAFARTLFATTLNMSAYAATVGGAVGDIGTGCLRPNGASLTQFQLDLPLPIGAVPSAVAVKYRDTSTSAMSIQVRVYGFEDGVSPSDNGGSAVTSSTNGTNGVRVESLVVTAPAPVTPARGYYLIVTVPSYANGDLAFCGAQVTYTVS